MNTSDIPQNANYETEPITNTYQPTDPTGQMPPLNQPPQRKRHPILRFFGLVLAAIAIVALFTFIFDAVKTDEQRLADYSGTWTAKAMGADNNALLLAGSFFVSSTTGIGDNFSLGIAGDRAQLVTFGIASDYSFALNGKDAVLNKIDGAERIEASMAFGKMTVKRPDGTAVIYEKISDTYEFVPNAGSIDRTALGNALDSAVEMAEDAGVPVPDNIDTDAIVSYVENIDPNTLANVTENVNMGALLNGDIDGALANVPQEDLDALMKETGLEDIAPYYDLDGLVSSLMSPNLNTERN